MNSIGVLIQLAGAVTLLVWSVRQVRTGVERAYGTELKQIIRVASGNRGSLVGVGMLVAMMLQSSTAVAMLVSNFFASRLISATAGLVLMLGADIGSALVVQILSFDLSWLTPLLLTIGGWLFLKSEIRQIKQGGRVLMGIALILVSLDMMSAATAPLRDSAALPSIAAFLGSEYAAAFILGAVFTWAIHSSVAAILLFATLASQNVLPLEAGVAMVLGANLGGGLIAMGLTRGAPPSVRRLPLGNLVFRSTGAVLALAVLRLFPLPQDLIGMEPGEQLIALHVTFNILLTLFGMPLTPMVAGFVEWVLPEKLVEEVDHPLARRERALDRAVMQTPRLALSSASRELLHVGEVLEIMLAPAMDLYEYYDPDQVNRLRRLDDLVDDAHSDIKLYLVELNRGLMSEEEAKRSLELIGYAINLEHIGDLISKDLFDLAHKRHTQSLSFSPEGWTELTRMHDRVSANLRLAMNVLVSGDIESARELVAEKEKMRDLERQSHEAHLHRLQSGTQDSINTSDLHMETVRAFKQINALAALVAYPILSDKGELLESRMRRSV